MLDIFRSRSTKPVKSGVKPTVLLVLDGWGLAPASDGNAVTVAKTPNMDGYVESYPHGELIASGESVGLPANEVGNTEVGHLTMGAGRTMLQGLERINKAVKDESFFDNRAFLKVVAHVKQYDNSKLHIMGLVGSGSVHSSMKHFYALLKFCKDQGLTKVFLHLFTDGRDSPPKQGLELVKQIEEYLEVNNNTYKIATIAGRYYGMDRDKRWERTQKAYTAMVLGRGVSATSGSSAIQAAYGKDLTDEFVEPSVVKNTEGKPVATIDDNDGVIFFNFRVDRPRQLTMALTFPNFEKLGEFEFDYEPDQGKIGKEKATGATFVREKWPKNLFMVTMTRYQKGTKANAIAFESEIVKMSLGEVLSANSVKQLHIAESEKERFVRYHFDGLRDEPFAGEEIVIVPSPKVATYDKRPEMSVYKIVDEFKKGLAKSAYQFFLMNFANPDLVAHSGNIKATIKALEHTDKAIGEVVESVLASDGTVIITADHGNAEELLTFPAKTFYYTTGKGKVNTDHSNNPVPVVVISSKLKGNARVLPKGLLADVAPTILALMGLEKPTEMTGINLLQ